MSTDELRILYFHHFEKMYDIHLTRQEYALLGFIMNAQSDKERSAKYIAHILGCSTEWIRQAFKSLEEKGYVVSKKGVANQRFWYSTLPNTPETSAL